MSNSMWTTYHLRWTFSTLLCASVPGSSDLIKKWIEARSPSVRPAAGKSLTEIAEEVISTTLNPEPEPEAPSTLIFQRVKLDDDLVLAVRLATIKAHLKDCAYQLQTYVAGYVAGEKSLRTKVANGIYWPTHVAPVIVHQGTPFVPILDAETGKPITSPTNVREKAIHVMTPQGQRSALKAFEFVEGAAIEFPLAVLTAPPRKIKRAKEVHEVPGRPVINEEDLTALMMYGGMHGYAGERSEDGGRYVFEIRSIDRAAGVATAEPEGDEPAGAE